MDDNILNEIACSLTDACKIINDVVIELEVRSKYIESEISQLLEDAKRVDEHMNYLETKE